MFENKNTDKSIKDYVLYFSSKYKSPFCFVFDEIDYIEYTDKLNIIDTYYMFWLEVSRLVEIGNLTLICGRNTILYSMSQGNSGRSPIGHSIRTVLLNPLTLDNIDIMLDGEEKNLKIEFIS